MAYRLCPRDFNYVASKLRSFFEKSGFKEAYVASHVSILSACERPGSICHYNYKVDSHGYPTKCGVKFPLQQTGQIELERLLLKDPSLGKLFCQTNSFRDEDYADLIATDKDGFHRHSSLFGLIEFESRGDFNDLREFTAEMLMYLGFKKPVEFAYAELCEKFGVKELENEHEMRIYEDCDAPVMIKYFPEFTSPFFNMKRVNGPKNEVLSCKIDTILLHETIGAASRSVDVKQMRDTFYTIESGEYAKKLFALFGKERVEAELEEFINLPQIERFGGGIGVPRLIHAMKKKGLVPNGLKRSFIVEQN